MEIIDAHVHVGRRHLPLDRIQDILDRAGADRAVVFADPESADIPDDNGYVLEVAEQSNHIPFLYVGGNAYSTNRPWSHLPDPEALDGFFGIKWHCWFTPSHDFGGSYLGLSQEQVEELLTEPRMKALMAATVERKIPVNFEEHFDVTVAFADLYPEVTIILPHMGGLNGGTERILEALGHKDNVHFDVSLAGLTGSLVREYGAHKFICGSDYPYGSPQWSIDRIRKLDVTEEERAAIFAGNILSMTGVE
jgi:hypothetical protein